MRVAREENREDVNFQRMQALELKSCYRLCTVMSVGQQILKVLV